MVGARIKNYLLEKGIKQSFLVEKTGLTASIISDIVNSNRVKIDAVEYYKICRALEVPFETFLDGECRNNETN